MRLILVAVDSSPRAVRVVRAAAEMARAFRAGLMPLRVIEVPPEFPPAAKASHPDALAASLRASAMGELYRLVEGLPSIAAPVVRVGEPWREIVSAADELDVDLIVIGSHGYGGWDRLLGTTAGKVANHAHRNVLIVHDPTNDQQAPPVE